MPIILYTEEQTSDQLWYQYEATAATNMGDRFDFLDTACVTRNQKPYGVMHDAYLGGIYLVSLMYFTTFTRFCAFVQFVVVKYNVHFIIRIKPHHFQTKINLP